MKLQKIYNEKTFNMEKVFLNFNSEVFMYLNQRGTYLPGQNVQDCIYNHHEWSPAETKFFTEVLSRDNSEGVVIDVGSNSGYFTLIPLSFKRKTISIEPNESFNPYIYNSVKDNNFLDNWKLINKFVTDRKGMVVFDGWSGRNINGNNAGYAESISISEVAVDEDIFLLKIDVEGCEDEVLKSCGDLLQKAKIKYLDIEISVIFENELNYNTLNILELMNSYYDFYMPDPYLNFLRVENVIEYFEKWAKNYKMINICDYIDFVGCEIYACRKDVIRLS